MYYYFLYKKGHPEFNSRIILSLSVVALIFVGLFFSSSNVITKRVGEVFSGANDYITGKSFQSSSGQRLLMYEAGITGISNHLWLGIGENDFKVFMKSETQRIAYTRFNQEFDGFDYSHIHNQFLMALITKGLFGFMSVLLLFIFLFFYFLKGMKTADITDKPVWIAGFVFSLAEFMSFMPESPLQRSVYSSHFFLITTLFIVFSLLITRKSSHLIPSKSSL
ncbi:O-antigen ligase family protein [Thiomicrorhabdus aquaedulcis]|uniref:O-antigen ligase family protein n=1 Tax=Thiomicrorhabdus aquaedulcis TaxID=2211106 RepID=UPI001E3CA2D1|nr:O-antigen ligase family protein [Thiomicrorhabdus aquaedulcis]